MLVGAIDPAGGRWEWTGDVGRVFEAERDEGGVEAGRCYDVRVREGIQVNEIKGFF